MQYSTFHTLHIGAAHIKKGLPCQDMCLSESDDRHSIAVVSDGHGNRRHFRSERGAQKACEIALNRIRDFLNHTDDLPRAERENLIPELKYQICLDWRNAILKDAEDDPWTQEEIEEQQQLLTEEQFIRFKAGETAAFAYGCTLCAVFTSDWGWGALQVGDGCLTVIEADGTYRWPMPESILNSGHRTASLCSNNPLEDFRHVIEYGRPAGLMVYTDGIEKAFPEQGKEIVALLHWVWKNQRFGGEDRLETLTELLNQITHRSPAGDDVSIAGMIDPNAEDAVPKFSHPLQNKELQALESQREELLTTVQYNRRRLSDIRMNDPQSSAEQQICRILNRREADLAAITKTINAKRAELGLPPLEMPEEEPEKPEEPKTPPVQEEPAAPETPESSESPESTEAYANDQKDEYFWESDEDREPPKEKKMPLPEKKPDPPHEEYSVPYEAEVYRIPVYRRQPSQRREYIFPQLKSPFDLLTDFSRFFDETSDFLDSLFRKH